ncbi:PLP-dependent aminotransferase family protein [Roseomonas sp. E05]|uniref:aminotransferase-like domain-containing protein n=1 Tax=Roseomonas sp. E05 TaxID=3046310 RepID=UPI0024B9C93B|nr:PLP-dependent aminotransferase family protein [Roseomonas sp. E05]MDJ0389175.1 PLP-dependent aminotransferase family protein [Roseomonas sp. E05]
MRRYEAVAGTVRRQIEAGTLKAGDRVPSIREMKAQTGFSTVTVQHGYALLESAGEIRAQARSGYFVAAAPQRPAEFPQEAEAAPRPGARPVNLDELAFRIASAGQREGQEAFGAALPSRDLFDETGLHRQLCRVLRRTAHRGVEPCPPDGDPLLREMIARRAARRGVIVSPDAVLTTSSGLAGLNLCLDTLTAPGDVVLVESPSFFPLLAALHRRRLQALEIYSHPRSGVDPDQFEHLLRRNAVRLCVMMPAHHSPTGVTYSEAAMRGIVAAAARHGVPILECDVYGELGYGAEPAPSLKRYDTEETVVQFGSFAGTLPAGYGLGWVLGVRHRRTLLEQQFLNSLVTDDAARQRAVADYILQRQYERRLRRVQQALAARMQHGLSLIARHFPPSCAVSRPSGGFMCWIRGPREFDALAASRQALRLGISLAPGPIFSVTQAFENFIGLNFSFPWDAAQEEKLRTVGRLLAGQGPAPPTAASP